MSSYLLVIGGIVFATIVYQIWSGKTFGNRRNQSSGIDRKTDPAKYWMSIAVQAIILAGFMWYFSSR